MARAYQSLRVRSFRFKGRNKIAKGNLLFIDRKSIGTIIIDGVPRSYNLDLVYNNEQPTIDRMIEDSQKKKRKKKVIRIRRK